MPGALAGVRVIDLGQYISGPLAALMLSDQGADVIHVDPPGGPRLNTDADAVLNRGKRRITLDLKQPADLTVAQRLVEGADVLIENFRPGVMDRLGLGADAMRARNPGLIYCSIPGFAADDPRAGMAAWEGIVDAATENCRDRVGEAPKDWDTSRPTYSAIPLASNFAAFLTVTSVAMALVAREKTGHGQQIDLPLYHAMFTVIGPAGAYPVAKGLHEPTPIDPNGSGCYLCGDGRYIQFDPNNHRFLTWFAAAAGISDWGPEYLDAERLKDKQANARLHERLAAMFLTRPAEEWEKIAASGGAVLAVVRTPKEWLATEHAKAIGASVRLDDPELGPTQMAGLPVRLTVTPSQVQGPRHRPDADRAEILAELERHNGASARTGSGPSTKLPLEGLRVLDLTQVLAGPTSGRILAEFGADVIKINGTQRRVTSHGYMNRGKRTILLDIESARGQQVFFKLLETADVVIQNFPPGTVERYGLGYEQLKARKPDLIYASLSCYGHGGPWAAGRGYERQGQAVTGVMERVGKVPAILGPYNLVDVGTGVMTAFAIGLAALHRLKTGEGQHVFSSLAQTAMYHQIPFMLDYPGRVWDEPRGWEALGTSALQRFYQATDGWFFLGARPSETGRLCEVAGVARADSLDDAALAAALEARFATDTRDAWVARLTEAGISAHVIVKLPQLMVDPWLRERGITVSQHSEEAGEVIYPGPSPRLSGTPARVGPAVRQPGADGPAVLAEIGLGDQIESLERAWVLQTQNLPPGW